MEDTLIVAGILLIGVVIGTILTIRQMQPTELENGCIVINEKIYCEYKVGDTNEN